MAAARGRASEDQRERLLRVLSAATFLIFFQAYMVAPLIPRLATVFAVSGQMIGLIIPAYMLRYGVSTLVSDQYAPGTVIEEARKHGVGVQIQAWSSETQAQAFQSLRSQARVPKLPIARLKRPERPPPSLRRPPRTLTMLSRN